MEVSKEMIVVLLTFIFLLLIKIESVTCSEERDVRFVKESRKDFDNDVRRIPLLRPPEVASPKKVSEEESQSVGVEFWRSVDNNERNDDIRGSVSDLVRNSSNSASHNLKKDPRLEDFQENNSTVEDWRENSRFLVTRLAQCRATCLAKRNLKLKKIERSLKTAALVNIQDIQIAFEHCWDTCMRLESHKKKKTIKEMSRTLMCKTATNCLSDCCEFHQEDLSENNKTSFAGVKVEPILSIAISGLEKADKKKKKKLVQLDLAWPGPSDEDEPVVYSVIQHVVVRVNSTPTWRLLAQTIKWNISLTLAVKGEKSDIRVLATSPTRLVRVFSVKVGAGNGISDDDHDDDDDVVVKGEPIRSPQPSVNASALQESRQRDEEHNVEEDWHLNKLSMIHRNFLVLTQITWNSRVYGKAGASATGPNISAPIQPKGQPSSVSGAAAVSDQSVKDTKRKFLLTWQEEGGLLKGNMVTDTNSVSISLLPNTQYLIQVGLVENDAGAKAADEDESNPWDSPVQQNVSKWSPLLKVNTSEAPEAISGKSNSNSSQAQEGESKTESSTSESHNVDHLPHHLKASLISSKRDELSGHRRLRHPSSGKLEEDHHHESERTLFGVTCECSGGKIGTKWCCQTLIVSFVLVLAGIYGLLILLSCLFYIFFYFFKLSPHQLAKDFVFYCSRSSLKLKLVEHAEDNDDQDGDHVQPDFDDSLRKGLGRLSQYNIV